MSEASYTAWDDNLYAWPPPEGWYQATDGRWWPAGYGPAEQAVASAPSVGEAVAAEVAGLDPYDQRTSAIPAGGLAAAGGSGPMERAEAETRRRVFDELPPIDDVFGGIDPYADDEEAIPSPPTVDTPHGGERPAEGTRQPEGSNGPGTSPPDAPDRGYLLLAPDEGAWAPAGNGSLDGPPAVPPAPSSLLGDPGRDNGAAGRDADRAAFDAAATVFAPSPPPPPDPAPADDDDPTGPMAGGHAAPPEPPPGPPAAEGPGRPPVEEWATATTILPRDDDGATTQFDIDALRAADRAAAAAPPAARGDHRAGDWGIDADWDDDAGGRGRRPSPADQDLAPVGGAAYHRESAGPGDDQPGRSGGYGGYGDVPLGAAPAPRRWWPLVAIGLAVLVAAASIGGYFLLRDDTQSASTDGGDPAGEGAPGSFASPYPFGKVVVVYYIDEATKEQRRWVIQVLAPVADATQQLVGAGTAPAPGQGEVLALTRVRITYQSGPEPGSLSDLRFKAVGAAPGTLFDAAAACPAASPLNEAAEVKVLDSAEGDLCWRIPQGELATLKLAVEAEAADGTVHMELNAPAGG